MIVKPTKSRRKASAETKALKATIAALRGTRERKTKQETDPLAYRPGMGSAFYQAREWKELRWKVLRSSSAKHPDGKPHCEKCGTCPPQSVMHVDHKKPRSKFPHLELDEENLQVLCEKCNIGKGASI